VTSDGKAKAEDVGEDKEEAEEEIISDGAARAEDTSQRGKREADIERIRIKALMRRAKARSELGGWSTLQGAEEGKQTSPQSLFILRIDIFADYKKLIQMPNLPAADLIIVQRQLKDLPPRTKAAQEVEMGEMMGKLKEVRTISFYTSGNRLTLSSWEMEYSSPSVYQPKISRWSRTRKRGVTA
jgi:hypothetical protein